MFGYAQQTYVFPTGNFPHIYRVIVFSEGNTNIINGHVHTFWSQDCRLLICCSIILHKYDNYRDYPCFIFFSHNLRYSQICIYVCFYTNISNEDAFLIAKVLPYNYQHGHVEKNRYNFVSCIARNEKLEQQHVHIICVSCIIILMLQFFFHCTRSFLMRHNLACDYHWSRDLFIPSRIYPSSH